MVQETLMEIFREIFADDTLHLTMETSPSDITDWDSYSKILIVEEAEKVFGIQMDLDEVFKIKNFGDFVKIIEGNLEK